MKKFHERLTAALAKPTPAWKDACVRGGNSGFFVNGVVLGGSTACPRKAYLRSVGVEEAPSLTSLMTWEVGAAWERLYALQGAADPDVVRWSTQTEVYNLIGGTQRFFSGRPDHVVDYRDGTRVVVETKSISSVNKFREVIADGILPHEYVAQVVAYMDALHVDRGVLAFGSFLWAGKTRGIKIQPTVREFDVRIQSDHVVIDGQQTPLTLSAQQDHRTLLAVVLESADIGRTRMVTPKACFFCPLSKGACAKFDASETMDVEEFTREAAFDYRNDCTEGQETAETAVLQSAV